jgi:hypothetical protein
LIISCLLRFWLSMDSVRSIFHVKKLPFNKE